MNKPTLSIVDEERDGRPAGGADLHIAAVSANQQHLAEIVRALGAGANISPIEGTLQELGTFANRQVPAVLIVDSAGDKRGDLERIEHLGHVYPGMAFILLCEQHSSEFLIQAMRVGVREVLSVPVNADELKTAIERIQQKFGFAPKKKGKVLGFISCKGGSGATFLAANLAYALATQGNKKVALFDLNLQFGDALLFLSDQKPATTLADVARGIHRLDPALLASSMVTIGPNLSVLAAPEDPAHGMEVKPEHISTLLKLARQHYDFVILDVARNLDALTIKALDEADTIFPVLQITLPFIRDGKRLMEVFRTLEYPKSKIRLVVNRYQKGGDIALADLEQSFGTRVHRVVPNHFEAAAASSNQGIPVAKLARASAISKALNDWSDQLTREPTPEETNWLARIFKRA